MKLQFDLKEFVITIEVGTLSSYQFCALTHSSSLVLQKRCAQEQEELRRERLL